MTISLTAKQLTYERDEQTIFADINFILSAGEILQVAGNNGSGKTTLLRVLTGLLRPTQGEISWCGQVLADNQLSYQNGLFYLGHKPAVRAELTAYENLALMEALVNLKPGVSLAAALTQVGLKDEQTTFTNQLSAGQQRRLALAKLIIVSAKLWILDEPFTALDSKGVQLIETLIAQHLNQGGMVILTSHQFYNLPDIRQKNISL